MPFLVSENHPRAAQDDRRVGDGRRRLGAGGTKNCSMPGGTIGRLRRSPHGPAQPRADAALAVAAGAAGWGSPRGRSRISHQCLIWSRDERSAQIRQRPAGLEHRRARPRARCACRNTRLPSADSRRPAVARSNRPAAAAPFEPVEHPRLVALGLQPAEEPGAGVRQALVIEVDRILRRQHARRGRTPAPASAASAAAASTAGSRPAGSSRRSRPCRGSRAGSTCPSAPASTPAPG